MAKREDAIIVEARERYEYCADTEAANRESMREDMEFRAGEQWHEADKRAREASKRPVVVIDKLNQYIRQIVNDQRQNRPAIKVRPVDDGGDAEVAEILTGVIRHIEDQSQADVHYDTAHEHAVAYGLGWLRLRTEYESDDTFNQTLKIESLRNPLSAYMDPDCVSPVGEDAEYAFIVEDMKREAFRRQYPKADQVEWDAVRSQSWARHWASEQTIRVAEYWRATYEDDELVLLSNGMAVFASEIEAQAELLMLAGIQVIPGKSRNVRRRKVRWYKVNGVEVLEETEWLSQWLGLVPVIGNAYIVDDRVVRSGIIRAAMDAQRIYNYQAANYIERVALAPKAPFIAAEGQVEAFEHEWANANSSNVGVLRYTPQTVGGIAVPPPQRQPGPDAAPGLITGMQLAEHDIQSTIGMYAASLGDRSNEKSGRAIMARQREGDVATFHYTDNLSRAIRQVGRVIVDMIPKLYDAQRIVRVIGEDGSTQFARVDPQLSRPMVKSQDGNGGVVRVFNPGMGRYDVAVSVGPSYTTRRQESAEAMMQFVQAHPPLMQVIGDIMVRSQDWPMADEMADRLQTMLPPQLQKGEEGEESPEVAQVKAQASQMMQQMQAQMQQMGQALQEAQQELAQAKGADAIKAAEIQVKAQAVRLDEFRARIEAFRAETERMQVLGDQSLGKQQLAADVMIEAASQAQAAIQPTDTGDPYQ